MTEYLPLPDLSSGETATVRFIREHVTYPHKQWCLIWPFSTTRGYGAFAFGERGKKYYAHRFMCELVNGRPPSGTHQAAHSCGDTACVNPHHLSWKTPSENGMDNRQHGTHVRSRYGSAGKLTQEQADAIRSQKDEKTLRELADEYGVSESCISNVWTGKTHFRPSKIIYWTDAEVQQLREGVAAGKDFVQIAKAMGRKHHDVSSKAYRLGLRSGKPCSNFRRGKASSRLPSEQHQGASSPLSSKEAK